MAKAHKKTPVKEGPIKKGMEFTMQVWLAGLGAFVKTQEEGSKLFESLVKEGEAMQARSKTTAKSKRVTGKATETWDELQHMFEERVSRALSRLGVPTHKDIEELSKRIEQLDKTITTLTEASKTTPKRSASRRASTSG